MSVLLRKPQSQVKRLISGSGVYICNECIELCQEILAAEDKRYAGEGGQLAESPERLPKPKEYTTYCRNM